MLPNKTFRRAEMAKSTEAKKEKNSKEDKEKGKKRKKTTISFLVCAYLDKKPDADTKEVRDHIVENGFPDTKFNKSHLAWYKYQLRKGKLKLPSGKEFPKSNRKKTAKKETNTSKSTTKKTKKTKKTEKAKKD
jgi:hypothetical protein